MSLNEANHRYEIPDSGTCLAFDVYLAEIGRLRMLGRSEEALNHLERTLSDLNETSWVQGRLVQALLNHDDGRSLTAINTVKKLVQKPTHDILTLELCSTNLRAPGKTTRPLSSPRTSHG